MTHPNLLYTSEIWTLRIKDEKRLMSIQIKFFRTAGYTIFDHKMDEKILEDLKV
jgi:hypothetical protein